MNLKLYVLMILFSFSVFGSPFKESTKKIPGYKFFILEGMENLDTEGIDEIGKIDESTIESLKEIREKILQKTQKKSKWVIVLDSLGGDIGKESEYINEIIEIINTYHQVKNEKITLILQNSCNSLCGIALIQLRFQINKLKLSSKVILKISKNATFGFHGASRRGEWIRSYTLEMIEKMAQYGVSSEWLSKNLNYFNSTNLTIVSASRLADEKSGWVLSKELF